MIIFLGHGRSDALLGAHDSAFPREVLFDHSNINILKSKKLFSLACRSSDFLADQGINSIGFTNLITEMNEVFQARQIPGNGLAYSQIEQEDISTFRKLLVSIVKSSLNDFLRDGLDLEELYLLLKLSFNKKISTLIMNNAPAKVNQVVNLLYESKLGMRLYK